MCIVSGCCLVLLRCSGLWCVLLCVMFSVVVMCVVDVLSMKFSVIVGISYLGEV